MSVQEVAGALELAFNGLSEYYGAIAKDPKTPEKEKEACLAFVDAESRLDKEDVEGCLSLSKGAVQKFEAIKHPTGVADTLRMMVLAYRIQADVLRSAEEDKSKDIKAALSTAEGLAREHTAKFNASGDKRSEAVLLLAAGEINYNKRGGKKRAEAFEDLKKARALAKEAGDKKVEATAIFVQANAAIKLRQNDDSYMFAQESYKLYEEAADKKGQGKALHIMALAQVLAEDFDDGIKTAEQALAIFKELELRKLEAFELFIIAHYYLTRKMGREAIPYAEDALELFKEVDFDGSGWTSNAFDCLTQAFICKGDAKKAMIISEEAVEYFQRKKDKRGQVMALSTLANSYCAKGDYEAAVPLIEETREIIQSLDDTRWEASILHQLASVHMLRESYAEAAFAAEEAIAIYQDLKDRHSEALAMNYITQVAIAKNDYEKAIQTAQEQAAIFNETGDKSKEASCLLTVATVHGTEGRLDDALRVAKEAQELFQEKKDRSGEARALNVLADIYCDLREVEQAVALAKEMRAKLQETGDMRAEVGAIRTLSNIYLASEMPGESVRAANEAVQLSKRVHDRRQLAENLILSSEANIALAMQDNPKGLAKGSERSLKPAKEAYKVAKTIGAGKLMGMAMHQTAYVLLVTVKPDEALKAAREAVDIFRQVDERAREAGSVILIAEIYHSKSEDEKALDAANEGLMLAKACGDPKKEKDANKLIEQIAGKKYAYYQPYPGEMPTMPQQAEGGGGSAQAAASAVAVEKQVGLDPNMVQATVSEMAKQAIGVDDELFLDSALMDSGMDSLTAVSFRNGLQQQLGVKLPSSLMFDYPTMKEVANRIVELSIENA
ncbi:Tetratricopeptide repeat protein 28 (TPR repeat protein 28) [Durusdinium trenchii]|uniref:Tetratricopeptide repeat protein 28 (TPR repeat protein 28) n=1 Tax=Durusdinium trenchii TaxID=1381693 RepID=A0ABP0QPL4_9DINO